MKTILASTLAAAGLALGALGCGESDAGSELASPPPAAAVGSEPADLFADPSCGRYENLNQPVADDQRRKDRCLLDALAEGRPAELVRTLATVEGDPFVEYYRVVGPREIELLVDSTRDSFGSGGWSRFACTGLAVEGGYLNAAGCREVPFDAT